VNWNKIGERGKDHEKYANYERFAFDLGEDGMKRPALPLGPLEQRVKL
jgi:hypothetical protein